MNSLLIFASAIMAAAAPTSEEKSTISDTEFENMLTNVSYEIHDEIISKSDFIRLSSNPEAKYKSQKVENILLHGTKSRPQSYVTSELSLTQGRDGYLEDRTCFEHTVFPKQESARLVMTQSRSRYADTSFEISIPYDAKPIVQILSWSSPNGNISYHRIEASAKTKNFSKAAPRVGYDDIAFLHNPTAKEAELSILSQNPCRSERSDQI